MTATCSLVATEQLPDTTARRPVIAGRSPRVALRAQEFALAKVLGQAQRGAGAAGDQGQVGAGRRRLPQDRRPQSRRRSHSCSRFAQRSKRSTHGGCTAGDDAIIDEPHFPRVWRLHHAHEIGVRHRGERMIPHARFGQEHVADEEVALVDRARVGGKGGAGDGEIGAERVQQRIGHRSNVAARRRIERRAVLEIELPAALGSQAVECCERRGNRFRGRCRARLERDDDGVDAGGQGTLRHADHLDGAHAVLDEHRREVGAPREVVGDATQ